MNNHTAPHVETRRQFKRPVAWLFGRQFLANFKWALLYTAFGTKLDPRDWMQPQVFPSDNQEEADAFWQPQDGEFWFDYISDVGDGMRAMYSVAYLCMSDLWTAAGADKLPRAGASVGLVSTAAGGAATEPLRDTERAEPLAPGEMLLPRGAFLFIGGDTTYHLSDYPSLHTRFQTPFCWAYKDLRRGGFLRDETRRPLFAIPGNHDYYDMLDGFRRQFRHPIREELHASPDAHLPCDDAATDDAAATGDTRPLPPQLSIPGFRRFQEASYVALRLPFKWLFWGLDTEVGKLDGRQTRFFRSIGDGQTDDGAAAPAVDATATAARAIPVSSSGTNTSSSVASAASGEAGAPDKLIVATCAPTTVFGLRANKDDEKAAKAFLELGLPRPFLSDEQLEQGEPRLRPDQIRLDLAGDIHQYARYWGSPSGDAPARPQSGKTPESMPNYASVVSGIGGAFLHPTTTYADEVPEQTLYPPEDTSRAEVARHLFKFWVVWGGGSVWLIGFVMAFVIYFGAEIAHSSRQAVRNFPPLAWAGLVVPPPITPTVPSADAADGTPEYFYGAQSRPTPARFKLGLALAFLSLAAFGATFFLSERAYRTAQKPNQLLEFASPQENVRHVRKVKLLLWPLVALTVLLVVSCLALLKPFRANITPFGNSMLVLLSIIWAAASLVLSLRYSDWLFEQSSKREIKNFDWTLTWVWTIGAASCLAAALWLFGRNNLTAYLLLDILFTSVVLGTFLLLVLMGAQVGGALQKGKGKLLMLFVGLWHALLQLLVPYLLVTKGTLPTLALAVLVSIVFMFVGEALLKRNRRALLVVAWVVYGALMLASPYLTTLQFIDGRSPQSFFWPATTPPQTFALYNWWGAFQGWWGLVPSVIAGVVGAVLACTWFGWYLGVCLAFHGHNNEAGGAARIERYKELIRFRLTENDLTGYVIAIDDPVDGEGQTGRDLRPRLIDVFRLVRRPATGD